jgi:hypothetical protein
MVSKKVLFVPLSSFRRKPESSYFKMFWTPASAGVTIGGTFYEFINVSSTEEKNFYPQNIGIWKNVGAFPESRVSRD